ncbi:Purine-cytosine permease [Amycolatopsis lurida]|uniref:Nitrate reductase n=1 Tax=Amycolatopsis lurida NRRL 2430 TaxID=1460371 RepID=A0A2P2FYM9_AMYLU|nr:cytosine permease [Amycolatopsis lurida]KFU81840.1 nitrate reductase [Amycolatopsis lurida NRRL 2430]SEB32513.1 Purine-cytosine permease [Amycolatopsis lurida]
MIQDPESRAVPEPPAAPEPASAQATRIETHGIDVIGDEERHGRARDLFGVWAAPNVSYLSLVVGGALVVLGLSLWQALGMILVGNLFWLLVGLISVSGPAAGTPSSVITRAIYGVRGNRVLVTFNGSLISVCYVALSLSAASVTAFSLCTRFGLELDTMGKALVIVGVAAVTLVISVYGHATIIKLYLPLAVVLAAVFAVLAFFVLGDADWSHRPPQELQGLDLVAALAAGLAMVSSAPLSYSTSADFARYLPRTTKPSAIVGWTAAGAYLPSVLCTALGAIAATALDMSDPQTALTGVLPGWFSPVFLIAMILGAIANNALIIYSSGLALQAIGMRIRRSRSVLFYGTVSILLTMYALLVSNFLDTVSRMLQMMVAVLAPIMAIYVADVLLRRNRYDGHALGDLRRGGPFWYRGGVNWAGFAALVVGAALAVECLAVPGVHIGFLAELAGGIDLSLPVGLIVPALIYVIAMRSSFDPSPKE